jgi:predicted kinase
MHDSIPFEFDYKNAKYRPTAVIMCGPPACGKSTFVKKFVPTTFTLLSRDKIRDFLFGRTYKPNKAAEDVVTNVYCRRVKDSIEQGRSVVVDKTNCNIGHLNNEIKNFKENGYVVCIKFFDVSIKTLIFREIKRRLTDRSKPSVPFKIIKDMKRRYDKINKNDYVEYILY